jgi:hypothetical protein
LVNSGTCFENTLKSAVLWLTGCNFPVKIYANGCYWEAEKGVPWVWYGYGEKKGCFEGFRFNAIERGDQLVGECSDAIEV